MLFREPISRGVCYFRNPFLVVYLSGTYFSCFGNPFFVFRQPISRVTATHFSCFGFPFLLFRQPISRVSGTHFSCFGNPFLVFREPISRVSETHFSCFVNPFLAAVFVYDASEKNIKFSCATLWTRFLNKENVFRNGASHFRFLRRI